MIYGICILLIGCLVFQELAHMKERQKLLDRIQAKDYPEFKAFESVKKEPKKQEKKEENIVYL